MSANKPAEKPAVLFLCTHNAARSQMAEAFLRRLAGEDVEVVSAGLEPRSIHPLTYEVMREIGFDLTGHESKGAQQFLAKKSFSYAISVCDRAEPHCARLFPGAVQVLSWPFEDPTTGDAQHQQAVFRRVRDQIRQQVERWWHTAPARELAR